MIIFIVSIKSIYRIESKDECYYFETFSTFCTQVESNFTSLIYTECVTQTVPWYEKAMYIDSNSTCYCFQNGSFMHYFLKSYSYPVQLWLNLDNQQKIRKILHDKIYEVIDLTFPIMCETLRVIKTQEVCISPPPSFLWNRCLLDFFVNNSII